MEAWLWWCLVLVALNAGVFLGAVWAGRDD